jgi:hypothetical protein
MPRGLSKDEVDAIRERRIHRVSPSDDDNPFCDAIASAANLSGINWAKGDFPNCDLSGGEAKISSRRNSPYRIYLRSAASH